MTFLLDRRRFFQLAAGAVGWVACRPSGAGAPGSLAWAVHRATRNTLAGAIGQRLAPGGSPPPRARDHPDRPRVALPEPPPAERAGGPDLGTVIRRFAPAARLAGSELPLPALATLLHLTYGVTARREAPLRAAPSAGALYAGEVYVVAERVPGLARGVYSYHASRHELVRLADGAYGAAVASALERPEALSAAPVWVLLTNVFHRYTHRYRNRGYRYALIDSGHIGENLRLAAAARGLRVATPLRFHDAALDRLLGLDGREEAVCALHAVGAAAAASASGAEASPAFRELVPAGSLPSYAPPADATAPQRYHAATRLVPGDATSRKLALAVPARRDPEGPVRALPAVPSLEAGVAWSIRERRSALHFREAPIPLAALSALLALGRGAPAARLASGLELRVVAHRVDDLPAGVYRHRAATHRLERILAGDRRAALERACLGQDKAASAAVAFAMVADVEAAAASGDRAYRDLLIEAGAIGQRIYLVAEALGLAARNLAAFFDDSLNALLAVDGAREAVVHLTLAGPGS